MKERNTVRKKWARERHKKEKNDFDSWASGIYPKVLSQLPNTHTTTHTQHTTKHTQKALRLIHTLRKSRITIGGWQKSIMTHPLTKNGLWSRTVLSAHTWLHTNTQTECWRIAPPSALTTLSLQELQRERERRRGCERRTARELQQQELMK